MRRGALLALALAAVTALAGAIGAATFSREIGLAVYTRQVESRLGRDRMADLPDGLHVAFCGTGSPLPDPSRAASCTAIIAGERIFIVDSGAGSTANLLLMGLPAGRIEAVLLTHFHSDHIGGLGDLALQRWVGAARTTPLRVYGPPGVDRIVDGFNRAYGLDHTYRTAHHGEAIAPPSGAGMEANTLAVPASGTVFTVLDQDGLTIRAVTVDHDPAAPAVAYRFDHAGRSLVVSGDLELARSPGFAELAEGADLLIVEALQPDMLDVITRQARAVGQADLVTITTDILDYHTTPEQAAEAAHAAGARALVLTHIVPALPSRLLNPAFLAESASGFDGPIRVARDGDAALMAAGTDAITVTHWPVDR